MKQVAIAAGRNRTGERLALLFTAAAAAFLILMLSASPALAAEVSAKDLRVSVWPEYDDPRVLVIMQGELTDDVELPVEISFPVPKGAEIGMACEVDPSGGHACKPYRLEDKGDYQTLTYTVESQKKVFFEYYYEAFPAGTQERSFEFKFWPQFPVGNLALDIQEPLRSTDFVIDPALGQTSTDSNGFVYHVQTYPEPEVGEPLAFNISYSKPDQDPSVNASSQGGSGGPLADGQSFSNEGAVYTVAGAVVFAILLFAGYRTFRPAGAAAGRGGGRGARRASRTNAKVASKAAASRSSHPDKAPARSGRSGGRFCTSCGTPVRTRDRFCSDCGEEVGS
ncbi:MAG: hypothetical protein Kow00129_16980 [Thermoleophilia bacterium]